MKYNENGRNYLGKVYRKYIVLGRGCVLGCKRRSI